MSDKDQLKAPDLSVESTLVSQGSPQGKSIKKPLAQPVKVDERVEKTEAEWAEEIHAAKDMDNMEQEITNAIEARKKEEEGQEEEKTPKETSSELPSKKSKAEDVSGIINILISSADEIEKALADAGQTSAKIAEQAKAGKLEPWIEGLMLGWRMQTKQYDLMNRSLARIAELQETLVSGDTVTHLKDKVNKKFKPSKDNRSTPLTGKKAVLAAIGKVQGLRKIHLLNSGFHVVLRPLSMHKLAQFYNTVDKEQVELGRILGDFSFLIADIKLKKAFMELMEEEAIVSSNLKDYDTPGTITRNVSFHDYDTLLWGACCSLFPNGMEIGLPCSSPDCRYVEPTMEIDLTKLKFVTYSRIPEEAQLAMGGGSVTEEEVQTYQKELLQFSGTHVQDDMHYHLQVPTIGEYISNGERILNTVTSGFQGIPSVKDKLIHDKVIINIYKALKPWISKLESIDTNGNVEFIIDQEQDALYELLDPLIQEKYDGDIYKTIQKFIHDTKLTHICYSGLQCPSCGKVPGGKLEDYVPLDMQMHFFSLAHHLLILGGLDM